MAVVHDGRGHAKTRPVLVVTATDEIVMDQPIVVAAISTQFPDPTPADCVALPWSQSGHPATQLWKRSAVVCRWLVELRPSDLLEYKGYVPSKTLLRVLDTVGRVHGEE